MSRPAIEAALLHEQIRIRGIVQGVGFRPAIWRLANDLGLRGCTRNDADGVFVDVWAPAASIEEFTARIRAEAPPMARIDSVTRAAAEPGSMPDCFEIVASEGADSVRTGVAADTTACPDCVAESLDPFDRRYRYPLTNCTNCGPRLSIVEGVPYDRASTSMSAYAMCAECQAEYDDPSNRRFHAQPNACHRCGPRASLIRADGRALCTESLTQLDDVDASCSLLQKGEIVAIKGIGGFHLACDASNVAAIERLRERKRRPAKPFALMAADMEMVRRFCHVSAREAELLRSPSAPIVILRRRLPAALPDALAPGQNTLGFMLPYTPLHHLLLLRMRRPILLTSGNVTNEPQCIDNDEARARLGSICDFLLVHDRAIVNRVDDSVVRIMAGRERVMRRARGLAPTTIPLPPGFEVSADTLALGGDLKNTFCLLRDGQAVLSQHVGDLHDARTYEDYRKNLALYRELFAHDAARIVVDLHPEYMATKLGREMAASGARHQASVQHHHAHLAACLGDNAWPLDGGKVLGIALDGLGLGEGGEFWGGEFLLGDYASMERLATFKPVALLGNARAMREPWRNTYAHIVAQMGWPAFRMNFGQLELCRFLESKPLTSFDRMLAAGSNAPPASSCGRLFDAVAAAIGVCRDEISYEGQAAIELEALVDEGCLHDEPDNLAYPFTLPRLNKDGLPYIEPVAMWNALLGDLILGTPAGVMAARFHKGLARAIVHAVRVLTSRGETRVVHDIALSGGVFQNRTLLEQVSSRLLAAGFNVLTHSQVPANDGGLSFGQALVDAARQLGAGQLGAGQPGAGQLARRSFD